MSHVNINLDRRRFLGTTAMTLATSQLSMTSSEDAQTSMTKLADLPVTKPETNTSFGPLKQIKAGPLNGGKSHAKQFSDKYSHRIFKGIGHNVPQEAPQAFAQAIIDVDKY